MHRALDVCAPAVMPLLDDEIRSAPEVKALLDATAAAQSELIAAAQQQRSLRAGVDFADIGLALGRFSRPIAHGFDPRFEAGVAHRHLDVFIDGLRDRGDPPLPGSGLTLGTRACHAEAGQVGTLATFPTGTVGVASVSCSSTHERAMR